MRNFFDGANYFARGLQGLKLKKVKRFIIIPLLINFILIGASSWWLLGSLDQWKLALENWLWDSLQWLVVVFWPLVIIALFLIVFYTFAILANWVAAPFNGLLSETVEKQVSSSAPPSLNIFKELPRIFSRELRKLTYYIPKALALLLLSIASLFIPVLSPFITGLWFLFSAWMMAIQYIDYPFDNHASRFEDTLAFCRQNRAMCLGFGSVVMFMTMIPFINILVMPIAVIGATMLFSEAYKKEISVQEENLA